MANPERVDKIPQKEINLLEKKIKFDKHTISQLSLKLFFEKSDKVLGPYSLITSVTVIDGNEIELIYDEGYRGNDPLDDAKELLYMNLGLSGIITRSIIALNGHISD